MGKDAVGENGVGVCDASAEEVECKLASVGCRERAVGKWHVGHTLRKQTPNCGGFESFLGWSSMVGPGDGHRWSVQGMIIDGRVSGSL